MKIGDNPPPTSGCRGILIGFGLTIVALALLLVGMNLWGMYHG